MRLASNIIIKKSVTTKPTTAHFRHPRMVSSIAVGTVIWGTMDSRSGVRQKDPVSGTEIRPMFFVAGERFANRASPSKTPIRLSLCRERLAWGVPQRATLLTPQQDVVKHAAREINRT